MNKIIDVKTVYYPIDDFNNLDKFINDNFGKVEFVIDELQSPYVHSDTYVCKNNINNVSFITIGMGARAMNTINSNLKYCELILNFSKMPANKKVLTIASQLVNLTKFPFKNNCYFSNFHTINLFDEIKALYGYECVVFLNNNYTYLENNGDIVNFYNLVPIYKDELEMIRKHKLKMINLVDYLINNVENFLFIDKKRKHIELKDIIN